MVDHSRYWNLSWQSVWTEIAGKMNFIAAVDLCQFSSIFFLFFNNITIILKFEVSIQESDLQICIVNKSPSSTIWIHKKMSNILKFSVSTNKFTSLLFSIHLFNMIFLIDTWKIKHKINLMYYCFAIIHFFFSLW